MSKLTAEQINKLDRKELIAYCDKNNIKYRTKDGTNDIRSKVLKSLGSAPTPVKPAEKVVKKVVEKPVEKPIEKVVENTSVDDLVPTEDVKFKQIGQNIIVVMDGTQYTKVEPDKAHRDAIKSLVESLNRKRTPKDSDKLIDIFTNKTKKVEKAVNVTDGKVTVDVEALAATVGELAIQMKQMMDILSKSNQAASEAPKTQAPPSSRSGEKPYR